MHHLFKVVQQKEQVLLPEKRFQESKQRLSFHLLDIKRLSDGRNDELAVTNGG